MYSDLSSPFIQGGDGGKLSNTTCNFFIMILIVLIILLLWKVIYYNSNGMSYTNDYYDYGEGFKNRKRKWWKLQ